MVNILHTVDSLNPKSGGTCTSTYDLVTALNLGKDFVDILTLQTNANDDFIFEKDKFIRSVRNDAFSPLKFSINSRRYLSSTNYDLYHINGLWLDISHAAARIARIKNKPYVITPHGMLYPQALSHSKWKKKLLMHLWYKNDLRSAACIHATCCREMEYYRQLGFTNPVAIIPNLVNIPPYVYDIKRPDDCFRIGFLGRIHPRKNVHDLITAWKNAGKSTDDGELLIIGEGDSVYMAQLRDHVRQLGLHNVIFSGFLSGKDKFESLASLTALFVPSDFENFGMVVPEALIVGTPVMASLGTPWEELNDVGCGWWCDNSINSLTKCIEIASKLTHSQLCEMGRKGRTFIEHNYSARVISKKMSALYNYILGDGEKLNFIYK